MADVEKTLSIEIEAIKNKILNQKVDIKTGLSETQIKVFALISFFIPKIV